MKRHPLVRGALLGALLALGTAGTAHAQATRTWVSGVGDDVNPCSRTSPCRTFAGAIARTAAMGEVDVLDEGDYGAVTVTKAVTISGASSTIGAATGSVTVAAGASDRVVLRNLALIATTAGSGNGVTFQSGSSLVVEDVSLRGFDRGINVTHDTDGRLFLGNVRATGNTTGLHAETAAGSLLASITGSSFDGNATGIEAAMGAKLSLVGSSIGGNATGGITATASADVNLQKVELSSNGAAITVSDDAVVRASQVLATANTTTTATDSGGSVLSYGDNRADALSTIALAGSTLSAGATAGTDVTYALDATTNGFLAGAVAFTCTGLPAGATCAAAPGLPGGTGSGAVTLTVSTTARKTALRMPTSASPVSYGALFLGLPLLVGLSRRKKRWPVEPFLFVALVSLAGVTACGDDDDGASATATDAGAKKDGAATSDGGDGGAEEPVFTPPGNYPFQVTAGAGSAKGSLGLTLIVQ